MAWDEAMGVRVERKGLTGLEREGRVKDGAQVSFLATDWLMVPLTIHYLL